MSWHPLWPNRRCEGGCPWHPAQCPAAAGLALGGGGGLLRSDKIKIYPPPTRPSSLITYQRKFLGSKVALKPLITGVVVTAHQYTLGTTTEELFKDELTTGTHEIQLQQPACCLEVTGAQMVWW